LEKLFQSNSPSDDPLSDVHSLANNVEHAEEETENLEGPIECVKEVQNPGMYWKETTVEL